MSRALTIYTHRTDAGRGALASEITPDDVKRGRGGNVGDFYVVEPGFKPQWTEREAFHAQWEKLASPKDKDMADLGPAIDDARAQIDALEPAAAPTQELNADVVDGGLAARVEKLEAQVAELSKPRSRPARKKGKRS